MKLNIALLSLFSTGMVSAIPRASVHDASEQGLTFGVEADKDSVEKFLIKEIRSDLGATKKQRKLRRLGGKGSTAAPTKTPVLFFQVDDDDSTITTLLNGSHRTVVLDDVPDCLEGVTCRGRIRSQITGTMDGTGCPEVMLAAGSVDADGEGTFGGFSVTCPSAEYEATSTVEKCSGSMCNKIDACLEDKGSGTVLRSPMLVPTLSSLSNVAPHQALIYHLWSLSY